MGGRTPVYRHWQELIEWNQHTTQSIYKFVCQHPSHVLVEIDIEDPHTADYMANLFETDAKYWGHRKTQEIQRTTTGSCQ